MQGKYFGSTNKNKWKKGGREFVTYLLARWTFQISLRSTLHFEEIVSKWLNMKAQERNAKEQVSDWTFPSKLANRLTQPENCWTVFLYFVFCTFSPCLWATFKVGDLSHCQFSLFSSTNSMNKWVSVSEAKVKWDTIKTGRRKEKKNKNNKKWKRKNFYKHNTHGHPSTTLISPVEWFLPCQTRQKNKDDSHSELKQTTTHLGSLLLSL